MYTLSLKGKGPVHHITDSNSAKKKKKKKKHTDTHKKKTLIECTSRKKASFIGVSP